MESRGESEDETEEIRSSVLPTATSVLQVQQRAEQDIRRANDVLEKRTRQLAQVETFGKWAGPDCVAPLLTTFSSIIDGSVDRRFG